MHIAYFDPIGGVAGDMLLAACLDAGADIEAVNAQLERLLPGAKVQAEQEIRQYLRAQHLEVIHPPEGHHVHRHLSDIIQMVEAAGLSPVVVAQATATFTLLAEAEGSVHGVPAEKVHFHEVGAVDSIVDTVGVLLALETLGVERIESGPLPVGQGTTTGAHGVLPLPVPAVAEVARQKQVPLVGRAVARELTTPTGAALLAATASAFGPCPALAVERVGYGCGTRRAPDDQPPNVVRLLLGTAPTAGTPGEVVVLEANLDDQSAEHTAYAAAHLLEAGALDVFVTPIQMKKGRPGITLTVLAAPEQAGALEDLVLRETSTLGLRRRREARRVLPREVVTVETPYGPVRLKVVTRPGGRRDAAPEYDDCSALAAKAGVPLRAVYAAALAAWR